MFIHSVIFYLDQCAAKFGSDYKTAKMLGVSQAIISVIRKRNAISDKYAVKIAKLLEIEPEILLIVAAIHRSVGKTKNHWIRIYRIYAHNNANQ